MRLLHVGSNHVRRGANQRAMRRGRCGSKGTDERQYLPLRRLPEYRRGDPASSQKGSRGRAITMKTFEFIRPADAATAITAAKQAKSAQQGADVRFLAGGTTLI